MYLLVLDPFALVRFGRTQRADLRRHQSYQLLVDAGDGDVVCVGASILIESGARKTMGCEYPRASCQTFPFRAVSDAHKFKLAGEPGRYARHHIGDECPEEPVQCAMLLDVGMPGDKNILSLHFDRDVPDGS